MTDSRKYRLLLAEDNLNDIFLVERAIKKADLPIQLFIVRDGEEALNYLLGRGLFVDRERYPLPMLVLSDMRMPRMNGLELLTWIRQQPEFQDLPVVIMSTSAEPSEAAQFNALPTDSYIIKPCSQNELIALLQKAIALLPPFE